MKREGGRQSGKCNCRGSAGLCLSVVLGAFSCTGVSRMETEPTADKNSLVNAAHQ